MKDLAAYQTDVLVAHIEAQVWEGTLELAQFEVRGILILWGFWETGPCLCLTGREIILVAPVR